MKIFVNADDWGLEPIRDKAIAECFRRDWLTSTTAVMNRPGLERATAFAHAEGFNDRIGLHINLIYDKPLTDDIKRMPLFCDNEGVFNAAFHCSTKSRLLLDADSKRAVAKEVRAQVAAYKAQGYTMMHADSHQHAHNDWSILPIIVAILKEEGFKSLRIARNIGSGMTMLKKGYKALFNSYLRMHRIAGSDYFGSISDFVASRSSIPGHSTVEIMCHPMLTKGLSDCEDGDLTDFYKPFDPEIMDQLVALRHEK